MARRILGLPGSLRAARIEVHCSNVRDAKRFARELRAAGFIAKEHARPLHGTGLVLTVWGASYEFTSHPSLRVTLEPMKRTK